MAEKPAAEKTEQPTPRRLQKAREKGQVAQSQELPAVVCVAALLLVLALTAPSLLRWFMAQFQQGFSYNPGVFSGTETFTTYFDQVLGSALTAIMPMLATLTVASILSCVVVSGLNFSAQALTPKLDELDPIKGFGKLFNIKALVKLGISVAKIIIVSFMVWWYIDNKIPEIASIRWAWTGQVLSMTCGLIMGLLIRVCAVLVVIAVIEVVFQKWKFTKDMMMTKQEVKQEGKEQNGSPEQKGRIRRIQIEMSRNRMLQDIPTADVVIVNPTHFAVVLKYDPKTMESPQMVAKGKDHLAAKIREIARAHGVPIVRKPELARAIYKTIKPGGAVPNQLFTAVAEVLAMVYRLRRNRG